MPVTIIATVGGATSNSYALMTEVDAYFNTRPPLPTPWIAGGADPACRLVIQATRYLDAMAQDYKELYVIGGTKYYRVRPHWTGAPATTTQALAWPRTGMFDMNGNPIPSNVIPQDLKDAMSEFAGQLGITDSTLNNDVIVQGIKSVRAGSVGVTFNDVIRAQVIPDAVWNLMPSSWFTEELYISANQAEFELL